MLAEIAGAFFLGVVVGLLGYCVIDALQRRRLRREVRRYKLRARVAIRAAADAQVERNLLIRRFGGDNPLALRVAVMAAARSLTDDERAWELEMHR